MLMRLRNLVGDEQLRCVATSATLATEGTFPQQQEAIAAVASNLFGATFDSVRPPLSIKDLRRETHK